MVAVALMIPSTSCTGGAASPAAIDPCDTEGSAPATSGGDHGPPWQGIPDPMADDTAEPKLDVVEHNDLGLPDIPPPGLTRWQEDPGSGIQYRRPTELELERNRWAGNLSSSRSTSSPSLVARSTCSTRGMALRSAG